MERTIHLREQKEDEIREFETPIVPTRIRKKGRGKTIIGIVIVIAVFFGAGIRILGKEKPWTSVFLANGQVYFGKLSAIPLKSTIVLKEIYYLQVRQALQPQEGAGQEAQQEINLVKLGNELHGPKDEMFIPKTQILFWEEMKEESQVVRAIRKYKEAE